jgi:hypothetical protein
MNYKRLAVYILLVIVLVWAFTRERRGRYALSSPGIEGVYVLDTATSKLWYRSFTGRTHYLGTNKNPAFEIVEVYTEHKATSVTKPGDATVTFGANDPIVEQKQPRVLTTEQIEALERQSSPVVDPNYQRNVDSNTLDIPAGYKLIYK